MAYISENLFKNHFNYTMSGICLLLCPSFYYKTFIIILLKYYIEVVNIEIMSLNLDINTAVIIILITYKDLCNINRCCYT